MADPTREEIDAKIAASEARTENRFSRSNGKLDLVLAKIDFLTEQVNKESLIRKEERSERVADGKSTRTTIVVTIITSMIAMFIGIVVILQFGDQMFSRGVSQRDAAIAIIKEMQSSGMSDPSRQQPAK